MTEVQPGELPKFPELADEYQIVRELGRGGTAVVYLARDRELGRDVAIKLIRPGYVRDEDAIARLLREARTIGKLQHPSIVMLLGTRRLGENGLALILQYMPGATLKDEIQSKGPLSFLDAERILRDLASALQYAHAHRIVHRDIKPENIYLDEALSLARLADFGIARAWDSDSGLTLPGTAIGTPAYMSPEQVDGKELDGRSDIYSLGLVGYQMLTGRQPWAGEGLYNVIYKQKHEDLPPITDYRPDIPKNLLAAIEKAIRKDPADRWKEAGEFLDALAEGSELPPLETTPVEETGALSDFDEELEAIEVGIGPRGAKRRADANRRRALMGVGAALLAFLAIGLIAIGMGGQAGPILARLGSAGGEASVGSDDPTGDPALDGPVAIAEAGEAVDSGIEPAPTALPVVRAIEVLSGDRQVASSGETLPVPLVVRVTDGEGSGVAGVPVVFEVMSGGGVSSPERAVSGADGTASADWTLGPEGDEGQMLVAWAEGLEDEGAVFLSFVEGGELDIPLPALAEIVAGAEQSGTAGQTLSEVLALRVLDEDGEPVAGAPVRIFVENGDGEVTPGLTTTNEEGVASFNWRLGPIAGNQAVVAAVEGMEDVQLRFEARAVAAGLSVAPAVAAGGTHSCALGSDGGALCWGGNADGQMGDGSTGGRLTPAQPVEGAAFTRLVSGLAHVCALNREGEAYCWGANGQGQLGTGSRASSRQPSPVSGTNRFRALAAGVGHTCGIDGAGAAYCWGSNSSGQLGDGSGDSRNVPTRVSTTASFAQIAAGWQHTCALDGQGRAFCWGSNGAGQLGDDGGGSSATPVPVAGGVRFRALAAGNAHTCGLSTDDRILCWGANDSGQLGDGSSQSRPEPQPVATTARFSGVAAGGVHTCGLTVDGGAMCWGTNVYGQLGDGTTQARSAPGPVVGFERFSQIEAFGSHTCGRTLSGGVLCWGYNVEGQIGDGTRDNRLVPTPVASTGP